VSAEFNGITKEAAGQYLERKRREKGLEDRGKPYTQSDITAMIGIPQVNQMTYYERGHVDWRKSIYRDRLLKFLKVPPDEALEQLGVELLGLDASLVKPAASMVIHRGLVQSYESPQTKVKKRMIECPLVATRQYNPDHLFVLETNDDTMIAPGVDRVIPAGAYLLFAARLEPRLGKVVVATLTRAKETRVNVLKLHRRKEPDFTLETYSPSGARFSAQAYSVVTHGVCLGFWLDMPY
jgi:hypothetical protein